MNNTQRILLTIVLVDFLAFTGYALWVEGVPALVEVATSSLVGAQLALDLALTVAIGVTWMWSDAKARGINPIPYTLLSLVLGAVGLLAYLVRRPARAEGRESAMGRLRPEQVS